MEKVVILGASFYGTGKFMVTAPLPAHSGQSKNGSYEGFGVVQPRRGIWGVTTPELKNKIVRAIEKSLPVSLIYDSFGNIIDIM